MAPFAKGDLVVWNDREPCRVLEVTTFEGWPALRLHFLCLFPWLDYTQLLAPLDLVRPATVGDALDLPGCVVGLDPHSS